MAWISDSVLSLYRDLNASMSTVAKAVSELPGILRRIHAKVDEVMKTNAQVIDEVRQIRGFVASLVASQEALRQQVADAMNAGEVDDEVVAEVDGLFEAAKSAAGDLAPAIVANPTTSDPVPQP